MGSKDRRPASALREDLLKSGSRYSYFQAMRLLYRLVASGSHDRIRTRPELSFSFPSSDISDIKYIQGKDEGRYDITATFLGLYGVSSPLPNFYTEDLFLEASEDRSTCRDFLDIFNERLYELLFRCWRKYHLFLEITEDRNRSYLQRLFCLLGIGEPEFQDGEQDPGTLLRYIGLLTQHPRSASGLITMLRDATGEDSLTIEPCVFRKVQIPTDQRTCLGQACSSLGMDTVIGSEIPDRQGKFRIQIGPLSAEKFQEFVPGGRCYRQLCSLTRFYMLVPLEYEMSVKLKAGDVQNTCLGAGSWSKLGTDTWLFTGDMTQDGTVIFYPQ